MESQDDQRPMADDSRQVSERTSRRAEAEAVRRVAEPAIWTDGMLDALVNGVKGGTWYSLIDKVYPKETLKEAFTRVKQNGGAPGVNHQTIEDYQRHLDGNLERLSRKLKEGTYRPDPVRRTWIPKPGGAEERPLGIPTIEDRIVQTAMKMVIEPIFEADFADHSYGFRPERGAKDALRHVATLLEEGYTHVVDADIRSYFDSIPHQPLMEQIEERITDGKCLDLIEMYLNQEVVDGDERWHPEQGTPQGGVISPLLANIYLDPLDYAMEQQGYEMVRYADDFVILCRSADRAEEALAYVERWMQQHGLTLHPDKTCLVAADEGEEFAFLGYRFKEGNRYPRKKSRQKFKEEIRRRTRRTDGRSLEAIMDDINQVSRGWFEYFKHSYHNVFEAMDGWIRRRLRALLRKRNNLSGPSTRRDNIRWPNSYFADLGLFSMAAAWRELIQSL